MPSTNHELAMEGRLSAVEATVGTLTARDSEILQALKDLQKSHQALAMKIDRYQVGAKVVIGIGTTIGGAFWFLWSNFGQWLLRR